jgi:hypothetical protein
VRNPFLVFAVAICISCLGIAKEGGDVSSGDNFHYNGKVDFLFVVDNSTSYPHHKEAAVRKFTEFIQWMTMVGVDFQIAFTTTTCGRYSNPGSNGTFYGIPQILTSSTQNLAEHFESRLRLEGAWLGSDLERGLSSSLQAIEGPAGRPSFLRQDASLMIFYFSDEDDYGDLEVSDFISKLDRIKPSVDGKRSWIANFYGALPGDTSSATYIEPGLRYISLSQLSGGFQFSLFQPNSVEYGIKRFQKYLSRPLRKMESR